MKPFLFLFTALSITAVKAQTFGFLDINQVKAQVNSGNDLHWTPGGSYGGYEVPKGSGHYYGGPASLWIGGLDAGNQLHLAAQTYHQSGVDYSPGPLSTQNATISYSTVNQYNRVWKLNQSDIDAFITNYANGNVQNGSYTPVADLLSWPGNGDIAQNQDPIMAPFADVNSDGIYDPLGSGDYPLIKGDQAIYTVFNDNYYMTHGSSAAPIGAEIRLMAYAYGTGTMVANNPYLNYATFYNYTIINRSASALYDTYIGLFNDSDIGTYLDDFVGCNVVNAYGYTYNNLSTGTTDPIIGIAQTMGPLNTTDGFDDDGDGQIDEPGEQMGMTKFMYFNNSLPGAPVQTTDPNTASQYRQYMTGFWKDGTPLTCGGQGYGGSVPTSFAYPGASYATGPCGSAPWNENDTGTDKKFVMSTGPFTFQPGTREVVEYAFISAFDSITNDPLGRLDNAVNALRSGNTVTGTKEANSNNDYTLSPNPAHDVLTVQASKSINSTVKIEVMDVFGKVILSRDYKDFSTSVLDISQLSSGIYFVKLSADNKQTTKKFIKG